MYVVEFALVVDAGKAAFGLLDLFNELLGWFGQVFICIDACDVDWIILRNANHYPNNLAPRPKQHKPLETSKTSSYYKATHVVPGNVVVMNYCL